MTASTDRSPWFDEAFGALYSKIYRHRSDDAARKEVRFAQRYMGAVGTGPVLDLACGNGRHQEALAASGEEVVGLDRSGHLLLEAHARGRGGNVRGDMRTLPFANGVFAKVFSFFTSFGYFGSDAEDRRVVTEVRRVLRDGGRYLIDFLDAEHVRETLVPRSSRKQDGLEIEELRRIENDRVLKDVTIRDAEGRDVTAYTESVRLYGRGELSTLLQRSELRILHAFGDFEGAEPGAASRLILIAEAAS